MNRDDITTWSIWRDEATQPFGKPQSLWRGCLFFLFFIFFFLFLEYFFTSLSLSFSHSVVLHSNAQPPWSVYHRLQGDCLDYRKAEAVLVTGWL